MIDQTLRLLCLPFYCSLFSLQLVGPRFGLNQCDQIGHFLKVLGVKLAKNVAKIFMDFEGNFEKHQVLGRNSCIYFLGNFSTHLGDFLFQHLVALSEAGDIFFWRQIYKFRERHSSSFSSYSKETLLRLAKNYSRKSFVANVLKHAKISCLQFFDL